MRKTFGWVICCLLCIGVAAHAQHRTREVGVFALGAQKQPLLLTASDDGDVYVELHDGIRTSRGRVDAADVANWIDSTRSILAVTPKRSPRERLQYDIRSGDLALARIVDDRGNRYQITVSGALFIARAPISLREIRALLDSLPLALNVARELAASKERPCSTATRAALPTGLTIVDGVDFPCSDYLQTSLAK